MIRQNRMILAAVFFLSMMRLTGQELISGMSREQYIIMYKPLAIEKMREFSIPASIALAQAIVESGSGNSELARSASNHFGIKCHEWTGPTFKWDDDLKNECFRKYANAGDSYYDHSLFLTRRPRYAGLFELEITDYKGWAQGLLSAGYATNPQYALMLIRIIEENRLYEIDQEVLKSPSLVLEAEKMHDDTNYASGENSVFGTGPNDRTLYINNRRLFVFARENDTYFKIANDFGMHQTKLQRLNEVSEDSQLRAGAIVFIEQKRRHSATPFHKVGHNETLHGISQIYGVALRSLYRLNNLAEGREPYIGDTIRLR